MSLEERRERMQGMRRQVMEYNTYMWAAKVLGDLRELRLEPVGGAELGRVGPSGVRGAELAEGKLA
jgi:trehalose-6-phosphate synthase